MSTKRFAGGKNPSLKQLGLLDASNLAYGSVAPYETVARVCWREVFACRERPAGAAWLSFWKLRSTVSVPRDAAQRTRDFDATAIFATQWNLAPRRLTQYEAKPDCQQIHRRELLVQRAILELRSLTGHPWALAQEGAGG